MHVLRVSAGELSHCREWTETRGCLQGRKSNMVLNGLQGGEKYMMCTKSLK